MRPPGNVAARPVPGRAARPAIGNQADGHVIAGAGCAGLSLAVAMVAAGVTAPITLVDQRRSFGRDRTWCLWETRTTPFSALARDRWTAWEVRTSAGTSVQRSSRAAYVRLDSRDVYEHALAVLERAPNVELRLGERVVDLGDGWVRTGSAVLEADRVYDAMAFGSPALRRWRPALWQGFLGWEVEVERPLFTPGRATLMDFRVEQGGELRFVYVLPTDERRALVEHTSIGVAPVPAQERREALERYLGERLGAREWSVAYEERGRLPMDAEGPSARADDAVTAIGVAGGAVRASSGYAFARIQRQALAVARAAADGRPPPPPRGAGRRAWLDRVFLHALAQRPEDFPEHFRRLVARTPADAFARFMTDESTRADEARVIAALPPAPFAVAALQVGRRRARERAATRGPRAVLAAAPGAAPA